MKLFHSLKYQIALAIFMLELVLLSVVLWQTQSLSYSKSQQEIANQDMIILQLLSEVSYSALFTGEFGDLQHYFAQAAHSPHIKLVYLSDFRDRVVASSKFEFMGKHLNTLKLMHPKQSGEDYWRHHEIGTEDGNGGQLNVLFSGEELKTSYKDALTLGMTLGLGGMLLISGAGILFGYALTRRLGKVIHQTHRFASGDMEGRCRISGRDEVAQLGDALNSMADQITDTIGKIEHMAFHDALTGLGNRRQFNTRLERALHSSQEQGLTHCFMYLDLDQFKVVNDTCGHDAGDHLLIELSRCLLEILRSRDTLARLGGDEFGILLENCPIEEASQVAEKVLREVRNFKFSWQGRSFDIGVSIGVVPISRHSDDIKSLMSTADIACYAAKEKGRNTIQIARVDDLEMNDRADQMRWVSRLSDALKRKDFVLFSQNIVRINPSQSLFGQEFLLRLRTTGGDLVLPEQFLPAAERYRIMPEIDRHVVELIFKHMEQHTTPGPMAFINLSGASMTDPDFVDFIHRQFAKYPIAPERICFEITETVAIDNFNSALNFIKQTRKLGCKFALDDFGSGMCSFTYLKSLPVDFVKIDGSFIANMLENPMDRSIVNAINDIAREGGFQTIAEYVEHETLIPELQAIGIHYAQGHAIHNPVEVST